MSELSFVNNVAKGVETLGLEHAPIIYSLAKVKWESKDERDEFLNWLAVDNG